MSWFPLRVRTKDGQEGLVRREPKITALARLDWQSAQPVLENLSKSDQPSVSALATSLLYKHAVNAGDSSQADQYRTSLESIVQTETVPIHGRIVAARCLAASEWDGHDEWYLSLLRDGTLWRLKPEEEASPLLVPVAKNPDKWIPIMTELVADKDVGIHNSAVGRACPICRG